MSRYTSVITRKGQITIPAAIRREWDLKEGERISFVATGGQVTIAPVGDVVAQTTGAFGNYRQGPPPTIHELKEIIAEGWAADARKDSRP